MARRIAIISARGRSKRIPQKNIIDFLHPLMVEGTAPLFDDWYCFSPGSCKGGRKTLGEFCVKNPTFELKE